MAGSAASSILWTVLGPGPPSGFAHTPAPRCQGWEDQALSQWPSQKRPELHSHLCTLGRDDPVRGLVHRMLAGSDVRSAVAYRCPEGLEGSHNKAVDVLHVAEHNVASAGTAFVHLS